MSNMVITGAGGFIGSTLVEEALKAGHSVRAIDRFFFGENVFYELGSPDRLRCQKKDIREITPADLTGADAVFDLAALSNDPTGELDLELTKAINLHGRLNVVRAAREAGVPRYIMASSCSVYGFNTGDPLTEDCPVNPQTAYARSMVDAERAAFSCCTPTFAVTAIRQATIFGLSRRMRFDLVVNTMIRSAVETGCIKVTGGGDQWRPLLHVRDAAKGFLLAAEASTDLVNGGVFNLGFENYRMRHLAEMVQANLPVPVEITIEPETADHRSYRVCFEKAKKTLGFIAERDVPFGIREVHNALVSGTVDRSNRTITVGWYKHLIEADNLVRLLALNGRML
jgi:nucleoside-diphosphate-sugar epimerase